MVNDMAEKQPNTRFEESGGGLYKIKGGIGHSDWSADGMQPHLADKMLEYLDENKDSDKPFFLYMALTAPTSRFSRARSSRANPRSATTATW